MMQQSELVRILNVASFKYFEIQRNNLPIIKDEAYVTNLDGYKSIGTHWLTLHLKSVNVTYFDSFEVEYIPKEINKNVYLLNTSK